MPVARNAPDAPCRPGVIPVRSNRKMSCMVMTSPSMPVISEIAVTLRGAVGQARHLDDRYRRPTRSAAGSAAPGCSGWPSRPSCRGGTARRAALLAWIGRQAAVVAGVHRLQHVERFLAADLADDDAIGPHTQGVDRPARAARTAPLPSMFAGRVSSRTTWRCRSISSAASSMVTTRSSSPMKLESMFSSVVLPAPVPPETMMFSRQATAALQEVEHRLRSATRARPGRRRRADRCGSGGSTAPGRRAPAAG